MKVNLKNRFFGGFQVALLLIGTGCSTEGDQGTSKTVVAQSERQSALSSAQQTVPSPEPSSSPSRDSDAMFRSALREYSRSHPNSLLSGLFPLSTYATSLGLPAFYAADHRPNSQSEKLPSSPAGSEGGFGLPSVIQRPVSGEEHVRIEFLRHEIEFRIEQLTKNYGQAFSESAGVPVRWYTTGRLASGQERFEALLTSIQEADEVKALEEILDGALEFDHLHSEDRARFIQDLTFLFVAQTFESEDAQSRYLSLL